MAIYNNRREIFGRYAAAISAKTELDAPSSKPTCGLHGRQPRD
jgi:hypothetical protein